MEINKLPRTFTFNKLDKGEEVLYAVLDEAMISTVDSAVLLSLGAEVKGTADKEEILYQSVKPCQNSALITGKLQGLPIKGHALKTSHNSYHLEEDIGKNHISLERKIDIDTGATMTTGQAGEVSFSDYWQPAETKGLDKYPKNMFQKLSQEETTHREDPLPPPAEPKISGRKFGEMKNIVTKETLSYELIFKDNGTIEGKLGESTVSLSEQDLVNGGGIYQWRLSGSISDNEVQKDVTIRYPQYSPPSP